MVVYRTKYLLKHLMPFNKRNYFSIQSSSFDQQFIQVSQYKLSDNPRYKAIKIKDLEANKIIHVEKVTERAKWIVCKKTRDKNN